MSNYPSPYQPPTPYGHGGYYPPGYTPQDPYTEALKPGRRAGVLMFILGGLFLICGGCGMLGGLVPSDPQVTEKLHAMFGEFRMPSPLEMLITGAVQFLAAIALLALAVPVRRASRPAIIGAMIATGVLMLQIVAAQVLGMGGADERMMIIGAMCGTFLFMTPFLLLLAWLVQALRAAPVAEQWSAYQRQYWQYMQSHAYGQGPYGPHPSTPAPPPGQPPIDRYSPPPPPPPLDRNVP